MDLKINKACTRLQIFSSHRADNNAVFTPSVTPCPPRAFHVNETSFPGIKGKKKRFPFRYQHHRTSHAGFITDAQSSV